MILISRNFMVRFGLVWGIVVVGLFVKAAVMGSMGSIGPDSDDVMRLVQIRDFLAGQNWFDPMQTRMGPGGTEMHWSRLVDIPIICLIQFFNLFVSADLAEKIAITVWPPLSSGLVIWGVLIGARNLSRHEQKELTQTFAVILLLFLLIPHFRFAPGAIDHHNLQLGLIALSAGYAVDPDFRARSYAISAAALALSIAIGVEVNAFAAIICGYMAVNWWVHGEGAKRATATFGIVFALTLGIVFLLTIAPANYGRMSCDALSLITVLAGGAGGFGLALAVLVTSSRAMLWRGMALIALGLFCAVILGLNAPQCLSNPLDTLPPEMTELWLGNIEEAQPLLADKTQWFSLVPFAIGTTAAALALALSNIVRRERSVIYGCLAALLVVVILLSLYQTRFYVFGAVISIPLLAAWIAGIYKRTRSGSHKSPVYMIALAASLPAVWGFPGLMLTPVGEAAPQAAQSNICYSDTVMIAVSDLDTGMFAATPNGTAPILSFTKHSALSGNYHRNVEGIVSNIRIFTFAPDLSRDEIIKSGVNYIHVCRGAEDSLAFAAYSPNGLMAQLINGDVPDYLAPLPLDINSEIVSIYAVNANY